MSEIKATRVEERTIGYKCDVCGVNLKYGTRGRLINETPLEWFEADLCPTHLDLVKEFIESLGGTFKDRWS
jgi:hypothetical protein